MARLPLASPMREARVLFVQQRAAFSIFSLHMSRDEKKEMHYVLALNQRES
jgi:hypothetical protein